MFCTFLLPYSLVFLCCMHVFTMNFFDHAVSSSYPFFCQYLTSLILTVWYHFVLADRNVKQNTEYILLLFTVYNCFEEIGTVVYRNHVQMFSSLKTSANYQTGV